MSNSSTSTSGSVSAALASGEQEVIGAMADELEEAATNLREIGEGLAAAANFIVGPTSSQASLAEEDAQSLLSQLEGITPPSISPSSGNFPELSIPETAMSSSPLR